MRHTTQQSDAFYRYTLPACVAMFIVFVMCSIVSAQVANSGPRVGEVVGNDVYIRSGPSENYYPVIKLSAGDRVTVVGQQSPWLEILPPVGQGAYSWISAEYVDSVDGHEGVVNGSNVRVRAGSTLAEFERHKSRVQLKVNSGTQVRIVGRHPDGYLKIEPPAGVTFWISQNLVEFELGQAPTATSKTSPNSRSATPPIDEPTDTQTSDHKAVGSDADVAPTQEEPSQFSALESAELRKTLEDVEVGIVAELGKPVVKRDFSSLADKLRPLTAQTEDEFARRYAVARLTQINDMTKLVRTISKMHQLDGEVARKRREFLDARSNLLATAPPVPAGLDAKGELRESALYPPGSSPRRYRLVDPTIGTGRTIGYIEIAPGSNLVIGDYLGRFVGVRASTKKLQSGAVDPVPIYVASELVLMQNEKAKVIKADAQG